MEKKTVKKNRLMSKQAIRGQLRQAREVAYFELNKVCYMLNRQSELREGREGREFESANLMDLSERLDEIIEAMDEKMTDMICGVFAARR